MIVLISEISNSIPLPSLEFANDVVCLSFWRWLDNQRK